MSVLLECISVIARCETLEAKYPGGLAAYADDCPNATYCNDGVLTRVGFMAPSDVERYVNDVLDRSDMTFLDANEFADIAVVDRFTGPTARCVWLNVGEGPEGIWCTWLAGTEQGDVAVPQGWKPSGFVFVRGDTR
jgi:hypothetical protein